MSSAILWGFYFNIFKIYLKFINNLHWCLVFFMKWWLKYPTLDLPDTKDVFAQSIRIKSVLLTPATRVWLSIRIGKKPHYPGDTDKRLSKRSHFSDQKNYLIVLKVTSLFKSYHMLSIVWMNTWGMIII